MIFQGCCRSLTFKQEATLSAGSLVTKNNISVMQVHLYTLCIIELYWLSILHLHNWCENALPHEFDNLWYIQKSKFNLFIVIYLKTLPKI